MQVQDRKLSVQFIEDSWWKAWIRRMKGICFHVSAVFCTVSGAHSKTVNINSNLQISCCSHIIRWSTQQVLLWRPPMFRLQGYNRSNCEPAPPLPALWYKYKDYQPTFARSTHLPFQVGRTTASSSKIEGRLNHSQKPKKKKNLKHKHPIIKSNCRGFW